MAKELTESRRTRYTRRAMQDALIELLRNQPLGSITVKALCERADVNRSTFTRIMRASRNCCTTLKTKPWPGSPPHSNSYSPSQILPASSMLLSASASTLPTIASICRY